MSYGYQRLTEGSAGTGNEVVFIHIEDGTVESVQLAAGNGTSNFNAIVSGTAIGKITASGKYRPVGKQVVDGTPGSQTTVNMASVDGFYVGDPISGYDVSGSTTLFTGRTITAIDAAASPPTITVSSTAVTYQAGDYIYVEDGSATARGYLRAGVFTQVVVDAEGDAVHTDQPGLLVSQATVDEDKADAIIKHNTYIKTDLQTVSNGGLIIFR